MNARINISVVLLLLGLILVFLPPEGKYTLRTRPGELLYELMNKETEFTVDQVARFIVSEDSSIQLIDLRSVEEFHQCNIPGSVNIPYRGLLTSDLESILSREYVRTIFYSNDDLKSNYALVIARGLGYRNNYTMKGGLNEWFNTVMHSEFRGDKITPRENALFEIRTKAKKIFTEINSMPDSLKARYFSLRRIEATKLDGGCE
jgi:rhodanese-related sulfurtransferase